ncbi:MAG: hypothetical protein ACLUE1_03560 [Adlercreutzia equolifaciens]
MAICTPDGHPKVKMNFRPTVQPLRRAGLRGQLPHCAAKRGQRRG